MMITCMLHRSGHRFFLSLIVVVIDQSSKLAASHWLQFNEPLALFPGFNLTLVHNTGAAFSLLRDAGGWQRYFFIVLTLCVAAGICIWLLRLPRDEKWLALSLSLILGGALGNLCDRIYLGYVVDFFDVYYGKWHWPVFNVADSAITAGAVLLVIDAIWLDHASVSTHSTPSRPENDRN